MPNTKPLQVSLEELVDYVMNKPTVFLVGSGVSRNYPSALPTAWEMLYYITLPVTSPQGCPEKELKRVAEALPELYYEALIEFTERKAASLWEMLTFEQTKEELWPFNLGPNSGHMALVYLAWHWNLPLITVNYDLMLEFAARKMGLHPIVGYPKAPHGYVKASKQKKEISIWKVHGSADDIDSIRTTLYDITSLEAPLLDKIRQLFENYRSCLIGYSGRDIDLFPKIANFKFPAHAFWSDINFKEWHRIYQRPDKFVMVKAGSTDFAHQLVNHIPENDPLKEALKKAIEAEQKLGKREAERRREEAKEIVIKLGAQHARQMMEKLLPQDSPDRLLIHGLALANISESRKSIEDSLRYLDRFLEHPDVKPWKACRALIIQAHSLHELSRFIESEKCARKAFQIAVRNGLREERGHALASLDAALRGQHLPQLGWHDKRHLKRVKAWQTFGRMMLDIIRIRLYCPSRLDEQSTASQIRARWTYLGHLSRVAAIIQRGMILIASRLPVLGTLLRILIWRISLVWWRYFEGKSKRNGYAVGVAIANRHIKRLSSALSGGKYVPSMDFYSLMSASEQILFAYDEAEALLRKGENELAREKFKSCLAHARKAGNKVVMLKAFIGLYRCGEAVDVDEVGKTLAPIQGDAYRKIEAELLHTLLKANEASKF